MLLDKFHGDQYVIRVKYNIKTTKIKTSIVGEEEFSKNNYKCGKTYYLYDRDNLYGVMFFHRGYCSIEQAHYDIYNAMAEYHYKMARKYIAMAMDYKRKLGADFSKQDVETKNEANMYKMSYDKVYNGKEEKQK